MITTACSACGKSHRVKPEILGKKARCSCGSTFTIIDRTVLAAPHVPVTPTPAVTPVAQPAPVQIPSTQTRHISRSVREWAGVLAALGWLAFAGSFVAAGSAVAMTFTGELSKLTDDNRISLAIGVVLANIVATGLISIGKAERLAGLFPAAAAGPTLRGTLSNRFRLFGELTGRTRADITNAVGRPIGVSRMGSGTLVQWGEAGYHISVMFDGDGDTAKCQGITSQIAV